MAYWYSTTFILDDKAVKGLQYFLFVSFQLVFGLFGWLKNGIGEQTDIERDLFL